MRNPKRYYVYIMTNGPKPAVLYVGITGDLPHRVWQHKNKLTLGFTSRYNLTRLVYYECFIYPDAAIAREKEIKAWRRSKKLKLIESMNPRWDDLAKDWQNIYKPESYKTGVIPNARAWETLGFSRGRRSQRAEGSPLALCIGRSLASRKKALRSR